MSSPSTGLLPRPARGTSATELRPGRETLARVLGVLPSTIDRATSRWQPAGAHMDDRLRRWTLDRLMRSATACGYCQRLSLTSGRFAMIDNGLGFSLVPWTPEIDRHLGHHVTGLARKSGGIEWNFGASAGWRFEVPGRGFHIRGSGGIFAPIRAMTGG
jgi:hypothetical protein